MTDGFFFSSFCTEGRPRTSALLESASAALHRAGTRCNEEFQCAKIIPDFGASSALDQILNGQRNPAGLSAAPQIVIVDPRSLFLERLPSRISSIKNARASGTQKAHACSDATALRS
jgi:hypothetical protein